MTFKKLMLGAVMIMASSSVPSAALASEKQIAQVALAYQVPVSLALYVAKLESGYRCTTPGRYNGPLQISRSSAKALGYSASEGPLNSCGAGLRYGMKHLKLCYDRVGNNRTRAKRCHASPGNYGVRLKR